MKRLWISLLTLTLVACSKPQPAPPVRPVLFVVVQAQSEQSLGRFAGNIQARYESTLGFRVGGRIAQRKVDVGTEVTEGQLLAVLDPTDQQNALRSNQGDLARQQAQWINAEANARRQQALFDHGVGAQAQLDIALTDLKTATAARDQSKASVQQAEDQLNYSELRADHAAVVTEWRVEAGQVVTAGQQVVSLARPDIKEAVIDLPTELAGHLPADVVFHVAAQLDPNVNTTATVRELEPLADSATRTRRARLTLADTPPGFRLGTAISVTLSSAITPRTELPVSTLQNLDGQYQVWVIDAAGQSVAPRPVQVVSQDQGRAVVVGDLQAGDRVVSAGVNSLQPGQKIKIAEVPAQ